MAGQDQPDWTSTTNITAATVSITGPVVVDGATAATGVPTFAIRNVSAESSVTVVVTASSGYITVIPAPGTTKAIELHGLVITAGSGTADVILSKTDSVSGEFFYVTVGSGTSLLFTFAGVTLPVNTGVYAANAGILDPHLNLTYVVKKVE